MKLNRRAFTSACAAFAATLAAPAIGFANHEAGGAQEEILRSRLESLSQGQLRSIAREPILTDAVRAQNRITRDFSPDHIIRLEGDWRREVYAPDTRNLIPSVMETPASRFLRRVAELSEGLYTEFILMDARGLNVALSVLTPSYWQGERPMFRQSYGEGLRGAYFGDDEYNPATGIGQRRIALTLADPHSLMPIGALCAGVDLARL